MSDDSKKPKAIEGDVFGPDEELPTRGEIQSGETRPGLFGRARTYVQRKDVEGKTKLVRAQNDFSAALAEGATSQFEFEMALKKLSTVQEEGTRIVAKSKHDRQEEELRGDSLERNAVEEKTRRIEAERLQKEEESRAAQTEKRARINDIRLDLEEAELKRKLDQLTSKPEVKKDPLEEISILEKLRAGILRDLEKMRESGDVTRADEEDFGGKLERIQKRIDELTRSL